MSTVRSALFVVACLFVGARASTAATLVSTDLVSPLRLSSARLPFHEGQADAAGNLIIDPVLPAVPGAKSPWIFAQWNHVIYTTPTDLTFLPAPFPLPTASFFPSDQEAGLVVQDQKTPQGMLFTLFNSDGTLTANGGRATYLTTPVLPNTLTSFDAEIDLSLSVRLSTAWSITFNNSAASTGAVMAQAYSGVGVMFVDPAGREAPQFVFMQVPLTVSNAYPIGRKMFMCSGAVPVLFSPTTAAANLLPFRPDRGRMHAVTANLSAAVREMLSTTAPCGSNAWDVAKLNLANWHFTGLYVGSETENTDLRPGAVTAAPQGHVAIGLDIMDISVVRRPG